ncbi:hypothetical protein [Pontiella agarivorans]|uniref:Uncharacterized protein n=1 Tax=Pontiella agarivorans TaxID=3038953 RepID=A0ABU5MYK5_9BACT|nr:hypothetical protein [Pontiella agarivorans]MDZ8119273.1 hypothetical protein [Pontiella agarivorans]
MKFTPLNKRIWIKGLTLECPFSNAPDDCPLNALRHLPAEQMNQTINNLSDDHVDNIVKIHQQCYSDRTRDFKRTSKAHRGKSRS